MSFSDELKELDRQVAELQAKKEKILANENALKAKIFEIFLQKAQENQAYYEATKKLISDSAKSMTKKERKNLMGLFDWLQTDLEDKGKTTPQNQPAPTPAPANNNPLHQHQNQHQHQRV